jgi:RNA polymerase sigma-70 factor (ECF subfamily)
MAESLSSPAADDRSEKALAFDALYQAHAPSVWRWARRIGGPDTDVEDVVQEVFLRACRGFPSFRGESDARTWLYRITVRFVMRQKRRRRFAWRSAGHADSLDREREAPADEHLQSREAEALLYRALDSLDARKRALLVAFELQELSGAEIAAALGLKLSTFWVKLHRARVQLRHELERLRAE